MIDRFDALVLFLARRSGADVALVTRVAHRLDDVLGAAPWVFRFDHVTLRPDDRGGVRIELDGVVSALITRDHAEHHGAVAMIAALTDCGLVAPSWERLNTPSRPRTKAPTETP